MTSLGTTIGLLVAIMVAITVVAWVHARRAVQVQNAADAKLAAERRALLVNRYGAEIAERIISGQIWQNMTVEQLRDSKGEPAAIDEAVTAKKIKQVWKYDPSGRSFNLRVTVEGDKIVGWKYEK